MFWVRLASELAGHPDGGCATCTHAEGVWHQFGDDYDNRTRRCVAVMPAAWT